MPTTTAPTGESDPHDPLLNWDEAFDAGTAVVGGKGWNLARLARYGFAVPRGGVVAASVYAGLFRTEVAALAAPLAAVTAGDVERADVQSQLAALRDRIVGTGLPPATREAVGRFLERTGLEGRPLAVRSSAVAEDGAEAAFAGVHGSRLGVTGLDAVCAAVSALLRVVVDTRTPSPTGDGWGSRTTPRRARWCSARWSATLAMARRPPASPSRATP